MFAADSLIRFASAHVQTYVSDIAHVWGLCRLISKVNGFIHIKNCSDTVGYLVVFGSAPIVKFHLSHILAVVETNADIVVCISCRGASFCSPAV
jgi:hypothetical protein